MFEGEENRVASKQPTRLTFTALTGKIYTELIQ